MYLLLISRKPCDEDGNDHTLGNDGNDHALGNDGNDHALGNDGNDHALGNHIQMNLNMVLVQKQIYGCLWVCVS